MKKLLLLLSFFVSLVASSQMQVNNILVGEYANYIQDDKGGLFTHDAGTLVQFPIPERIIAGSAGHPWASVVGESGQVYAALGDSKTFKKIPIANATATASLWMMHAVISDGKLLVYDDNGKIQQLPSSVRYKSVDAGWYLVALGEDGTVFTYAWSTGHQKFVADLSTLNPKKVLTGASAVQASRSQFNVALVNGVPYAWCDTYGGQFLGVTGAITTPRAMTEWGLTEKLIDIDATDHVIHMITESNQLLGMGILSVGEVGNGRKDPQVEATGRWDMGWKTKVAKPVRIGGDRLYKKLAGDDSYDFRHFAQELDGTWNSWGYVKFGLLLHGIRPADDASVVGLLSVSSPHRFIVPLKFVNKSTAELKAMVANGTYPPSEPFVNKPPSIDAGIDTTVFAPTSSLLIAPIVFDTDGQILKFGWTITLPGGTVMGSDGALKGVLLPAGMYVVEFYAIDNNGARTTDSMTLTVVKRLVKIIREYSDGSVETENF